MTADKTETSKLLRKMESNNQNQYKHKSQLPPSSRGRGALRFEMRKDSRSKIKTSRSTLNSLFPTHAHDQQNRRNLQNSAPKKSHSKLYDTLNPKSTTPSALTFQRCISFVILLDSLSYIISTEPGLKDFNSFFYVIEGITSTIFLIEYIARLTVCREKRVYAKYGAVRGRWKFIISGQSLLDAFATFPFFLELLLGIPLPTLTYLRVFRLLRIMRKSSSCKAMDTVARVFYFNKEILNVAALLATYLVIITSILMYYLRPRGEDVDGLEDQTDFDSIANTMVSQSNSLVMVCSVLTFLIS